MSNTYTYPFSHYPLDQCQQFETARWRAMDTVPDCTGATRVTNAVVATIVKEFGLDYDVGTPLGKTMAQGHVFNDPVLIALFEKRYDKSFAAMHDTVPGNLERAHERARAEADDRNKMNAHFNRVFPNPAAWQEAAGRLAASRAAQALKNVAGRKPSPLQGSPGN